MLAAQDANEIAKGEFYNEYGNVVRLDSFARDRDMAQALWKTSENLVGIPFRVV